MTLPAFFAAAAICAFTLLACEEQQVSRSEQDQVSTPSRVRPPETQATPQSNPSADTLPDAELDVGAVCARAAKTATPSRDMPSRAELVGLAGCDSEALYYGINSAPDLIRARHCAFAESERGKHPVMGGPGILMMIYANGLGVQRNGDLALRFACEFGGAEAELGMRVSRIVRADHGTSLQPPLDICDDITSGYMMGFCAGHRERMDAIVRNKRRRAATAEFPSIELDRATRAANAFFDLRARNEVDLSGTGRAMFQVEEKARLEDGLVGMFDKLRDPAFVASSDDLPSLESEMTSLLARIARCDAVFRSERELPGAISRRGVRTTQIAWVRYRTAFSTLALKVRPKTTRDIWESWLSQQRLLQLRELARGC